MECCAYKPLLVSKNPEKMKPKCLQVAKRISLIIGMLVGCLIQSSTLGMSWMLFVRGLNIPTATEGQTQSTCFVYAWSILSALMGVSILVLMRKIVDDVARIDGKKLSADQDEFLLQVYATMDYFFTIGMVSSVGLTWCITDHFLGMNKEAYQCFAFMVFCLAVFASAAALSNLEREKKIRAKTTKVDAAIKPAVV